MIDIAFYYAELYLANFLNRACPKTSDFNPVLSI